ncbi:MAG: glycoside-pentoside-hexuronide (GPH):cation symporter [Lachnospiraceae bacterium]|nr:glycoside-pentoside-hexuronide (GPH):cation symporter [Lachnospiraceae bacterium]
MEEKNKKRNLWFYPLGTVGRDMIYVLFTNFVYLYVLYTRDLTNAQLAAITGIMVAARVFDAINDPLMGNIIERTRSKFGKFKPWLVIGLLSTCAVVYVTFNNTLQGWPFIWLFGVVYFMYSITYTMNDIAFWGMIPALSKDNNSRNQFTSRATLFAGIGNVAASVAIPLFTTGAYALGGNAQTAYGRIALIICILAPAFSLFTIFGVKENRDDMAKPAAKISFKKIVKTIGGNKQLLIMCVCFLIQQVGNNIAVGGVGANYIYFEFGYEGGLYSTFTTVGMAVTAVLMVLYPVISRKIHRKSLLKIMMVVATLGYIVQFVSGMVMPTGTTVKFWVFTIGFMLANFGQYGMYLVMMISIINTVEYNELQFGTRDEGIITSMRPFLTKLASSLVVVITTVTYVICRVTDYTNDIQDLEQKSNSGLITAEEKDVLIDQVISSVGHTQNMGLLICLTVIPCVLMLVGWFIYNKFYKLDEDEYERICNELEKRKEQDAQKV